MTFDVAQVVADRIDAELALGTVPWRKPWRSELGLHRNLASGRPYRGINQLLTSMSGYSQPLWTTKKGMHAIGGRIKDEEYSKAYRGSTMVVLWKRYRRKPREGEVADKDGKVQGFMLRYYTVWNIEQTEGLEDHYVKAPEIKDPDAWLDERLMQAAAIIKGYPTTHRMVDGKMVDRRPPKFVHGGARAFYAPRTDRVQLPHQEWFDSPASYCGTMFHEFVHSTGHTDRLSRFKPSEHNYFGSEDYSAEELTAEFGAAMLMADVGLWGPKDIQQSAAYIGHWRQVIADEPKCLVYAAARAQKAVDFIVSRTFDDDTKETEREEAMSV